MSTAAAVMNRTLALKDATPEALAPYGEILGSQVDAPVNTSSFYGDAVAVSKPVEFVSDETTELTLCKLKPRPLEVKFMERHFLHTQTFVPLGGKPFVAVLSPPNKKELPDLDHVEAFRFDGSAGFTMKIGTWHEFPFALQDMDLIVILRRDTMRDLSSDRLVNSRLYGDEAVGPDLEKRNLVARANVLFRVATRARAPDV